ncbi:MAG: hypothetical protein VW450_02040 [Chloroflexota bacterium]
MRFRVIHEVLFSVELEAASEAEAAEAAEDLEYADWHRATVVREQVVPLLEEPRNPSPSI